MVMTYINKDHNQFTYTEIWLFCNHLISVLPFWAAAVFGEQKTDYELKPAGNGFKERTRIANYTGLPELMSMFKQVADIRTADTLTLDVPECDYQVVQVEATPFQQELVQELADRADAINAGNVDPTIDNMLKITSDGRKLGLDPRLIDPSFEDNPDTKLNRCVENVVRIHAETAEDRLTQIIFCDLGVPHKAAEAAVEGEDADDAKDKKSIAEVESLEEECDFCVYDDIRDKLIARGIPAEEIAYIHDAKTEQQKADLFDNVNLKNRRIIIFFRMPLSDKSILFVVQFLVNQFVVHVDFAYSLEISGICVNGDVLNKFKSHFTSKFLSTCIAFKTTDIFVNLTLTFTFNIGTLIEFSKFNFKSVKFCLILLNHQVTGLFGHFSENSVLKQGLHQLFEFINTLFNIVLSFLILGTLNFIHSHFLSKKFLSCILFVHIHKINSMLYIGKNKLFKCVCSDRM